MQVLKCRTVAEYAEWFKKHFYTGVNGHPSIPKSWSSMNVGSGDERRSVSCEVLYERLLAATDMEEVNAIVDNDVRDKCDECSQSYTQAIQFTVGEYRDPQVCADCLRKALALLERIGG